MSAHTAPLPGDHIADKPTEVARQLMETYGAIAELTVSERILLFEHEGDVRIAAAWRAVGDALRRLRSELGRH